MSKRPCITDDVVQSIGQYSVHKCTFCQANMTDRCVSYLCLAFMPLGSTPSFKLEQLAADTAQSTAYIHSLPFQAPAENSIPSPRTEKNSELDES